MPVYLLYRCDSANSNANAPGRGYAVDSSEWSRLRGSEPSLVCQMAAEYESGWAQGTNGSLHAKPFAFWKRAHNHIHTPPLWTDPQTQTRERETAHERERVSGGGERETEERERADTRDTLIVFAFSGDAPKAANAMALTKIVKLAACV